VEARTASWGCGVSYCPERGSWQSPSAFSLYAELYPFQVMKAVVQVQKEGEWYVATDLVTHVADQGKTREEAVRNLTKGLREHYEVLLELAPRKKGTRVVEIEV